jgi:DNA polymerase-3 subunit alpha
MGQNELFGGAASEKLSIPATQPWLPAERLQKEFDAIGFFLSGHPLDDYAVALKRLRVQSWSELSRAVKAGATAGKVAGTVVARTERRTRTGGRMGIVGLSDPSGHYEAVIFAEGLQQYRDLLEPGSAVLLSVTAELQGEEVRARIHAVEPLDRAAERLGQSLRVFMRSEAPLDSLARRLEQKGDGEVTVVMMLDGGTEVEVRLPGHFKVSPQIAGAIKAVPGVVLVEAA